MNALNGKFRFWVMAVGYAYVGHRLCSERSEAGNREQSEHALGATALRSKNKLDSTIDKSTRGPALGSKNDVLDDSVKMANKRVTPFQNWSHIGLR